MKSGCGNLPGSRTVAGERWLVAVTALAGVGFVALLALADDFRRSFGASENGPLVAIIPLVVLAALLAGLLFPGQKGLVHVGAAAAVAVAVGGVWVMRESVATGSLGLVYCALWLSWYFAAGRLGAAPTAPP